ncbi:MAG: serine hydrolase domain-containing protein [Sumerlaeia bacterium]
MPVRFVPMLAASVFSLLATVGGAFPNPIEPTRSDAFSELDAVMESGIADGLYPGGVLVVGTPGEILWAQPYGRVSWEDDAATVTLDTIYDLASVSKVVGTATGAWLMLGEDELSLSDPVEEHIAGFGTEGKETVTIKELMTHTSGLKAYDSRDRVEALRRPGETHADALIRAYAALPASYTPRESYTYSCLNFQTLARIVENAAGKRLETLLVERVFGPMGMNDTRYLLSAEQLARTAPTHRDAAGKPVSGTIHDPLASYHGAEAHCPGNAGLFGTAPDLAKYCAMVLQDGAWEGGQLIPAEVMREAKRSQIGSELGEERGLGWDVFESRKWVTPLNSEEGERVIGHLGYTGTMLWLDQRTGTYFVMLTNRTLPRERRAGDQAPSINAVRGEVCQVVLRGLTEYEGQFFGGEEKTAGGGL